MAVFDFGDAKAFFDSIERAYNRYQQGPAKSTEELLYVIMGLNHLREWISPDFNPGKNRKWPDAKNIEQKLSKKIYEDDNYTIIRSLCNSTKHARYDIETDTQFGLTMDEWPDLDAVANFDLGPPKGHCVNGKPIDQIIDPVVDLYSEWFSSRPNS